MWASEKVGTGSGYFLHVNSKPIHVPGPSRLNSTLWFPLGTSDCPTLTNWRTAPFRRVLFFPLLRAVMAPNHGSRSLLNPRGGVLGGLTLARQSSTLYKVYGNPTIQGGPTPRISTHAPITQYIVQSFAKQETKVSDEKIGVSFRILK